MLVFLDKETNQRLSFGSANVVFETKQGRRNFWGILTARHNFTRPKDEVRLEFYSDGHIETHKTKDGVRKFDFKSLKRIADIKTISIQHSDITDLSLIVVEIKNPQTEIKTARLFVEENCQLKKNDFLVSVGFPGVYRRPQEKQRIPITDAHLIRKRWSQGFYLGDETGISRDAKSPVLAVAYGTTLDALTGSSGGAVLNDRGEVIGVVSAAGSFAKAGEYIGDESQLKSHAYIVDCQQTLDFARDAWALFLAKLRSAT